MRHGAKYKRIAGCRVCREKELVPVLDLGRHALANALKDDPGAPENKFPLTLSFCGNCSLVQINETVNKNILFNSYFWVTGTSATTRSYAEAFCKKAIDMLELGKEDLVVEIASNDGTFLVPFKERGFRVLGVDPAKNVVEIARKAGIKSLALYWDSSAAEAVRADYGPAKLVIARNVIPHVSELHDVIRGVQLVLRDDGAVIIEFHYAGKILQELHYDSIYHEHLCYFSINSLKHLLHQYGLHSFHIEQSPISGGAYAVYASKVRREPSRQYTELVHKEKELMVNDAAAWRVFADRSRKHRDRSRETLKPFAGKTVVGFGSSARSSTYLNFCGFTSEHISAVIDNNKLKQGRYTAGSSIPIVSFEEGLGRNPDLFFILAWNFKDEIIRQCVASGFKGPFLIPFPDRPHILQEAG